MGVNELFIKMGAHMASVEHEPIMGSGGAPSGVQGQSPWLGSQGNEAPSLEAENFLSF